MTRIQAIAQSIDTEQTGLSKLRLLKSGLMEDLDQSSVAGREAFREVLIK